MSYIPRVAVVVVNGKITVFSDRPIDVAIVTDKSNSFWDEWQEIEMDTTMLVAATSHEEDRNEVSTND